MRGNIQGLLAQAQKMQKNVERAQAELANMEVTGEAGAGLVKVTITCKHECKKVEIAQSLFTGEADDKEMIEDLGIPVLVDRSSYESNPLGRMEWLKLYGLLLGKEDA